MFYIQLVVLFQVLSLISSFSSFVHHSLRNNLSIHNRIKASTQLNKSHRDTIEASSSTIKNEADIEELIPELSTLKIALASTNMSLTTDQKKSILNRLQIIYQHMLSEGSKTTCN